MQANQAINSAFKPLMQVATNAMKLDAGYLMKQLFLDVSFKNLVIDSNTDLQLYNEGIDSKGKKLRSIYAKFGRSYSDRTIQIKQEKGQPSNRVTLFDTGEFYRSFKLSLRSGAFYIDANTVKSDNDLAEVWGKDILGLTDENLQHVIDLALEIIIPIIRKKLLA